jgi:ABC-type oligopeptide transport system substrate-binding subunit
VVSAFYWERHPDGPFATLIGVAATYCSPDAYDGAYEDLVSRARSPQPEDEEMQVFKAELQQALADPSQLPDGELDDAVEYNDESDETFLPRLWRDLYGDETSAS